MARESLFRPMRSLLPVTSKATAIFCFFDQFGLSFFRKVIALLILLVFGNGIFPPYNNSGTTSK